MREINERPICHRSEDLVTYLYGEATAVEAEDFSAHIEQCDACRAEHAIFTQVHDSIVAWRNEALGAIVVREAQGAEPISLPITEPAAFAYRPRKLSALAALREFFTVSPLWLRGATAFGALLLCALLLFAVSRSWRRPINVAKEANEPKYSQQQLDQEVEKQLKERMTALTKENPLPVKAPPKLQQPKSIQVRSQVVINHVRSGSQRARGLNRQEREQLAADLGLIPGRDEELPFVLPDQPNQ